jgi:hypothetical protein
MFESQFIKLFILLLIGLFFLVVLVVLSLTFNRNRDLKGCLVPLLFIALLAAAILVFLDPEKLVECAFKPPEQIRLAGHITPKNNSSGNDFMVLLYKGDEEIARYITRTGRLPSEEEDREGYFELTAPNELGLTRCSAVVEFEQDRAGFDMLWMRNKTTYLWGNFSGLEPGNSQVLNDNEHRKTYRLVVLPQRVGRYPREIRLYKTFLDNGRNVAINVPVQTYRLEGTAAVPSLTGFFARGGQLPDSPQWPTFSFSENVRDAWVVDSNPDLTQVLSSYESRIIDRDNCAGDLPTEGSEPMELIYFKEVQLEEGPYLNFHPGTAAFKAEHSLGFSQGQMATVTAEVPMYAPPGVFRKYKLFWYDTWAKGTMLIDFGLRNTRISFRARTGMTWALESYDVDCPH